MRRPVRLFGQAPGRKGKKILSAQFDKSNESSIVMPVTVTGVTIKPDTYKKTSELLFVGKMGGKLKLNLDANQEDARLRIQSYMPVPPN
jgi:hypothetical protein